MWKTDVPTEIEEATQEVQYMSTTALIAGVILVAIAVYIIVWTYLTPGLMNNLVPWPLMAIILFLVMGVCALYVGGTVPSSARKAWADGRYKESDKDLRGIVPMACLGGIVPGLYALRAIRCLEPLAEKSVPAQFAGRACPTCSSLIEPSDRFCKVCGTPTGPAAQPPSSPPPSAPA
jgi:hypothetical protein